MGTDHLEHKAGKVREAEKRKASEVVEEGRELLIFLFARQLSLTPPDVAGHT
jgi:hypothetical protein